MEKLYLLQQCGLSQLCILYIDRLALVEKLYLLPQCGLSPLCILYIDRLAGVEKLYLLQQQTWGELIVNAFFPVIQGND